MTQHKQFPYFFPCLTYYTLQQQKKQINLTISSFLEYKTKNLCSILEVASYYHLIKEALVTRINITLVHF